MTGGNIAAEFHAAAIGRLDAPFLLDGQRSWTYGEFFDQVRVYAAVLIDAGAQPGDRVLVHVEKSPEAVALCLLRLPCVCPMLPRVRALRASVSAHSKRPRVAPLPPFCTPSMPLRV